MTYLIHAIIFSLMLIGGMLLHISDHATGQAQAWSFGIGLTLMLLALIRLIVHTKSLAILERQIDKTRQEFPELERNYHNILATLPETTRLDMFLAASFLRFSPRIRIEMAHKYILSTKDKASE